MSTSARNAQRLLRSPSRDSSVSSRPETIVSTQINKHGHPTLPPNIFRLAHSLTLYQNIQSTKHKIQEQGWLDALAIAVEWHPLPPPAQIDTSMHTQWETSRRTHQDALDTLMQGVKEARIQDEIRREMLVDKPGRYPHTPEPEVRGRSRRLRDDRAVRHLDRKKQRSRSPDGSPHRREYRTRSPSQRSRSSFSSSDDFQPRSRRHRRSRRSPSIHAPSTSTAMSSRHATRSQAFQQPLSTLNLDFALRNNPLTWVRDYFRRLTGQAGEDREEEETIEVKVTLRVHRRSRTIGQGG
ncbi:hypothetical protein P153DRAFT_401676 [Dothidotthia symphoricarpi CBS 119687]|uniref:Uncharacterized protein n=1 Tax=Dothidotthia symphoricarpi CBS 119687 TaxID=1392245 RepID=A0A6A5ZZN0_9PLEO|nr:uncharacterized protein P153DRAFT_401676 [Dothidotthia symphoricarpi CBS 119687]KAF2123781.1 hypothetical protein P153DRAFT_401676 [Dothidotthia symphoricarpi CBS 119687]